MCICVCVYVCRRRPVCEAQAKILEGPVVKEHELEGISKELLLPILYSLLISGFIVSTYLHCIFPNANFTSRKTCKYYK